MTPEDQLNPQREMSLPEFIDLAGDKLGVPKPLRDAIFQNESNFNHYWDNGKVKRSPKGAIGVGQLMPATAKKWKVDPENPIDNAYGALQEQKELYEKYLGSTGDANQAALLTAAAYNAGPGAVDKYGTIPPYHETQEYVRKVAAHLKRNPITQNVLSQSPAPVTARPAAAPPVPEELGPEGRQKTEQLPTRQTIAPPPPPPVAMPDPFAMQSVKAAESTVYPAGNTLASNTPASNTRWAKPGPYTTTLSPQEETAFQAWVKANKIPWQDVPESDYDMRGYFHALQTGDSSARTAQSKFDGKPHFPDTYKTPFHKTFSNESKYALPNAPHWQQDRLVDEQGNVVADETPKQPTRRTAPSAADLIVRTAVRNPDKLAADLRWHFGMNDPGDLRRLPVATQRRMIAMATTAAAADDRKRQEGENIEPSLEYQNQMRAKVGLGPNPALIDPRVAKPGLTKFHFNPQTPQEQLKESLGPLKTGPAPAVLSAPGADDDIRKQIRAQVVAERDARQKGPMTQARAGLAMADTAQRGTAIEDEVQRRLDDYKRAQATPREQDLAKQEIQRLEGQNYFARLWNQPTVESLVHKATATVSRDISHVLPAGAAKRLNELAESEQSQARIDDMVQNYGYAGNRGVLRRIGAESSRMAFNLGPQILVAETGIPFPLIAAGTSYLENGDKTPTERLEAAGAAYILAQAYTKGPAAAVSGLARISPRISRLAAEYPEITSRVTGGTLFGAAGGIEAAAKGGNREDIAVGAATGALPGIALGSGKRLAEEFGRIPESAIKAEWLPEPVRTAVARAKGYQPVIVQTDEASPRFASVYYKSPREQFVQEISPEQAAEFNRAAKGEKARPFITVNGADFDRVADFSTSNEGPKSATTEPAPINRQLEQDSPKAGNKITSKEGVSESANKISANPTIEAPPKTSENQPGRTDETLKENAPQSGATGATGPAAEAQVSAEAVRATGDIPDDNSLPGDVRGVPPVEGQPLGRITPKQIVRHSDPNIDGGEVVGRAPDGRLKVQNKEGGVSLVQDPRRQGNREAAIVKAEEPKEAEIVKEPDYTGETEAPITYQGRSWRPTVSMARTDDGEWKISGVKLHDDTTGEYKQILSSGGDQTFPTAEAAHEYALTQTRRVLGEKLPEPKTQRALPETATEPWPVRRAKNDVEVVNDSGGNLGPLQDAQHVADVYDKRGQLAYHLVTGRDAEGPILAKVPTENHPNETTEYVDNAMSVQQYMDDARSEGEDVRLVSQPKSITPTAAAKPSPNSIPSSSIFQSPTKAQDRAVYRGKKFWIGTVSTLDGEIENVYSRKEAEDYGAKHERYMRPADVDGINSGDRAMFWVDKNGEVQSEWRNGALSPELKQRIESQIERLGTQTPSAGPSAEVVTPPTPAEEGAKGAAETPSTPNESLESKPGEKHPETGRKFSSTQVNLPATEAKRVKGEGQRLIPDSALAADGREEDPHITVKYGLHTENADAVRELLADEPPVKVKIGKTSIFAAKEGADYDVVKLDVDSPDLHRLNAEIAKYLKVTDTHPEYKPHITLAYVKPGLGKRYEGRTLPDLTGKEITLDKVLFSSRNGDEVEIPLGGEVPTSKLQMGANGTYQKDQPGVETVSYPRTKAEKVSADVHVLDTGEGWVYGVDVELAREGNGRPMFGEPKETTREEALRAGLEEVYRTAHSEANNSQASEKQQAQAAKVMNWAAQQYNDLAPAEDTSTNKEVPENDQQQSTGLAKRPVENAPEEGVGGSAPSSTESDLDVNRPFRKRKYEETPLDAKTLALFRAKKAAEVGAIKEASSLTEGAYPEQEALDAKRREVDVLTQQLTAAGGALPLPEDYSDLSTRYLDTGKLKQDERPIEMLGKDEEWQTNTIDGKPAFTNGKFILIGEPTGPHTESYSPESMKRVLNTGASATEGERVAPFAIEDLTNTVLLTNGVRLDLGYLDLILDHYPNARLRYAEGKPNSMLSIVDGKKLVGALIVGKAKPLDKEFQAAANIALQRAAAKDARLDEVEQLIRPMRGPARRTERPRVTADQAVGEAQPHAAREVKRPKWMSGPTEMHAGMPFLRSLFSPKSRNVGVNVPPTASDFADVEERWTAAKGIKVPGGLAKATEALRTFFRSFKRHYIHLDPNQGPQSALTSDILRLHEASPAWAKAMAYDHLVEITGDLNDKAVDVLTRNLVLPDILKDIDEGLYEDPDSGELRELPFGYKSREQVEQDLTKFEKLADANPEIKAAIDRRKQITGAITRRLVDLDLLNPDVLKDDRYYHRQVLKYVNAQDFVSTGTGGGVRLSRKGFQKERAGGGDFNVRYQEAEFEWLSQAYSLIAKQETLDQLDKVNNIIDDLKRQAKTLNSQAMQKSLIARDELDGFRSRIGRANAELKEMAKNGDLSSANGRYDNLINQLAATPQKQPFNHPDWFAFLSHLLENDLNGKLQAAMIFKAIAQREKYTREFLGKDYKTWQDLVPDTHAIWQPEKGNLFFMASTVEEKALAQVLAGDRALESSDVKNQMVFGGKKAQWVMPKEVVQTLEGMTSLPSADPVEDLWVLAQNTWKQWVLLNPTRAVVYNFNNMSGDLDIALAYDPRILKKFKQAAADLWRFQVTHKASPALKADLLKAIKLGVVDSGLTITEIPDINKAGAFRALVEEDQNILARGVQSYWDGIKNFTSWRENILRLAAFRHFKENGGYGASNPDQINAIKDSDERAAKLARELIGDYGNVSVAGQWIRRHLIPFYSWIEINAPRYAQLLKNTARETGSKGKSGRVRFGAVTAKKVALLLLKAHALLALITLWNHLRFPEEEKELRREGRKPHIILGRAPDGSIRTLKFQGALADALEWFGFDDWPSDVADLLSGRKDWKDEVAETVKAPAERVVNSLEPFSKSVFELATGRQLYPHFFKEGSSFGLASRPIRDRKEYVARVFSLGALYNRVTGKPVRPFGSDPVWGALESFLVYRTDPGEAAYWEIRGRLAEWQEAHGRAQESGGEPTERQNALYYFKQASKWGDDDAAKKWLDKYRELGGTDKGLKSSIRVAHPLGSLARKDWDEFAKGLTPEEKIMLRQSIDWYKKTYGDIPEEDDSTLQEEVDRIMSGERGGSRRSHRTGGRPHHHQKQGEFQIPADQ
jgi:2'-5' RNA ligase